MPIDRREFCSLATAACVVPGVIADDESAPRLRVGILSDIHVAMPERKPQLMKDLRRLDAAKVDAVLITGDLFTRGQIEELEYVADAWFKVFPDDRRSDGVKIERLFITGNHDEHDWQPPAGLSDDEAIRRAFRPNREAVWKRLFHEEYRKIRIREVKGYKFVLRHWQCPQKKVGGRTLPADPYEVPTFLTAHADELRGSGRPFFFVQHEPIDDTVNATWLFSGDKWDNGQDPWRGLADKKLLSGFPNAVVLTGHSHASLTDEQSIWQGAFTAVNCGCECGWVFTRPGRENGNCPDDYSRDPRFEQAMFDLMEPRHGLIMDVHDDRIRFARLDFRSDREVGAPWEVPLFAGGRTVPPEGTPKYDFFARKASSRAPEFPAGAKVAVGYMKDGHRRDAVRFTRLDLTEAHPQLTVSFPAIASSAATRGFDFRVTCEETAGEIVNVIRERRVFSPKFCLAPELDKGPCTCVFAVAGLPVNRKIRFRVTPCDSWGNEGKPILSDWAKVNDLPGNRKS